MTCFSTLSECPNLILNDLKYIALAPIFLAQSIISFFSGTDKEVKSVCICTKGVFDFRKALPGKKYIVLCSQDSNEVAQYLIYEESVSSYIIFDIRDQINVYRGQKEITIINRVASGKITTSLWNALIDNGMSPALVMELEAIYAWSIDFFK